MTINNQIVPAFLPLYEEAYNPKIRHFFEEGGRGGAKSIGTGDFLITMGINNPEKLLCVREIQNSIKQSSHALLKGRIDVMGVQSLYNVQETAIRGLINNTEILFSGLSTVTEDQIKSFYDIMRGWVEEAQSISNNSLKILLPTIRAEGSKLYYTYNRKKRLDPVHALFMSHNTKKEKMCFTDENGDKFYWWLHRGDGCIRIEINYDGNPFFPDVLEQERARDEATLPKDEYNHIWLGLPEPQPADSILSASAVEAAMARADEPKGNWTLGVDVARNGKDGVEIAIKQGSVVTEIRGYSNKNPGDIMRIPETARRVIAALPFDDKTIPIIIDDTGLGGGLTDTLLEWGYNAIGVNFQQKAVENDKYINAISEMWLDFPYICDTITLPEDSALFEELTNRAEDSRDNRGRRRVESKDKFKAKIGRSPDKADAVLLACYQKVISGGEAMITLDYNIF